MGTMTHRASDEVEPPGGRAIRRCARASATLAGVAAASVFFSGCGRERANGADAGAVSSLASSPGAHSSMPPPPKPALHLPQNVLLILIDGLRGADMPWVGFEPNIAPGLNRFAQGATIYERAYSISSTTARSVGPLLAGRYPSEMAREGKYFTRYLDENVMLSELARERGFATIAVHAHAYFQSATGVDQGFQHYEVLPGTFLNNYGDSNKTSAKITTTARELIGQAAARGTRWFCYLHYMDPHAPYLTYPDRPQFGTRERDRYFGEVSYTDEWVTQLINWVRSQPWGDETTVVVTSDHGEAFGEHGHFNHGYLLYEEYIRVPLLIDVPGTAARRISVPRSHIDLTPTLAELMGLPTDSFRGESLLPEIQGAPSAPRLVVADLSRDNLQNRRRALVDGTHKLIVTGDDVHFELFDLAADPGEQHDLSESRPALLRELEQKYFAVAKTIPNREIEGPPVALKGAPEGRRW
jgi:arylsulfatase A-like enzyme